MYFKAAFKDRDRWRASDVVWQRIPDGWGSTMKSPSSNVSENELSVFNKITLIDSVIDEQHFKVLVVTETWVRADHMTTIKCDLAPTGFTISHVHRAADKISGSIAIILHEYLHALPFWLSGKY